MKCAICKQKVGTTVLGKLNGTYLNKKKFVMCASCQKSMGEKKALGVIRGKNGNKS